MSKNNQAKNSQKGKAPRKTAQKEAKKSAAPSKKHAGDKHHEVVIDQESLKWNYVNGPQGGSLNEVVSKDGYNLRITSIHMNLTYRYSGLIWGDPSQEDNDITLKEIQKSLKKSTTNEMPLYINMPTLVTLKKEGKETIKRLPYVFFSVELESDGTDGKHSFSSLHYVSFSDQIALTNFIETVQSELKKFTWADHAQNWNP
jgi:hypothetical protein